MMWNKYILIVLTTVFIVLLSGCSKKHQKYECARGVVTQLNGNTLSIRDSSGTILTFCTDSAKLLETKAVLMDDSVNVYYNNKKKNANGLFLALVIELIPTDAVEVHPLVAGWIRDGKGYVFNDDGSLDPINDTICPLSAWENKSDTLILRGVKDGSQYEEVYLIEDVNDDSLIMHPINEKNVRLAFLKQY